MEPIPEPPTSEPEAPPSPDLATEAPTFAPLPDDIRTTRPLHPGNLTPGWNTVFWLSWVGITAGLAAVWYSSRITGLATWWLGPEVAPRLILVSLLPFVAPIALSAMALSHRRWLPYWGVAGAVAISVVAAFDLDHVRGYAMVEFLLAASGLAVSLASFAGLLRRDPTPSG